MDTQTQPEQFDAPEPHATLGIRRVFLVGAAAALAALLAGIVMYATIMRPPTDFPENSIVSVEQGDTLAGTAAAFAERNIVRSKSLFQFFAVLYGGDRSIAAGDYYFEKPVPVHEVARRLVAGEHHLEPVRLTFPEGTQTKEMAAILDNRLPYFDAGDFLEKTEGKEGYLFPDTYLFFPTAKSDEVIKTMSNTFAKKIAPLEAEIAASSHTLAEIVTMASIIEGEANRSEDRLIVSGILWKRIALGMPLQVDATFRYINGKGSAELSLKDLKIDSPYNTYVNKGLPPGPISNPGLDAIKAALRPHESPYLYYLHDPTGQIHYGKTHAEHVRNKQKYLTR